MVPRVKRSIEVRSLMRAPGLPAKRPVGPAVPTASKALASFATVLTGIVLSCATAWLPSEALARRLDTLETSAAYRDERVVALSSLPAQAQDVHRRILSGGTFRHDKDGTVFGNRERLLPRRPRGYYREYTVPTPGARHRGARRIVCGGKDAVPPETCFYTQDHYQSFQRIDPRH